MATTIELSLHLPILPSQERPSQKTPPQYQRTIWPCHSLASCQTQIHSTIGSPSLDVFTVSKPSRTLDHRPRPRIEYQGEIRTNQEANVAKACLFYVKSGMKQALDVISRMNIHIFHQLLHTGKNNERMPRFVTVCPSEVSMLGSLKELRP